MKKICLLMLLALVLVLQGCMTHNPFLEHTTDTTQTSSEASSSTEDTSHIEPPPKPVPDFVYHSKYANQLKAYLSSDGNPLYLLLMNKQTNQFGDARYVPQNLTTLDPRVTWGGKAIELEARVAMALYAMLAEMSEDGLRSLRVTSAYRSYEYQTELYETYKAKEMQGFSPDAYEFFGREYIENKYLINGSKGLDNNDAETVANYYSARPGTSEHQTGLCVDFMLYHSNLLDNTFAQTEEFRWLSENAYRFGFILRYPEGKTSTTGYVYESWHYRYVGREAAAEIHFGGLTLEEYLNS